jgi:hypothetical protein
MILLEVVVVTYSKVSRGVELRESLGHKRLPIILSPKLHNSD